MNDQPKAEGKEVLYDYLGYELLKDGTCLKDGKPIVWYKNRATGQPWIPAKRKTFVSLVKQLDKE